MKKGLVIISFAFIFLLSISIVSAGFFDWLTGDATEGGTSLRVRTSVAGGDDGECDSSSDCQQCEGCSDTCEGNKCVKSSAIRAGSTFGATGRFGLAKLRGFNIVESATPGVGCYVKTQRTSLLSGFSRTITRR